MVILKGAEVSAKIKEEVQGLLGRLNEVVARLLCVCFCSVYASESAGD